MDNLFHYHWKIIREQLPFLQPRAPKGEQPPALPTSKSHRGEHSNSSDMHLSPAEMSPLDLRLQYLSILSALQSVLVLLQQPGP